MTVTDASTDPFTRYLDAAPLRGRLLLTPILCTLCMVFEGMDSNVISYVGPIMQKELGFSTAVLGLIYATSVASALIGAAGVAPFSDRWGRRPLLIATSFVMVLCTLATPFLDDAWSLVFVRFIVGIAFGAAVPTTFALAADYAPRRHRSLLIMIVTAGVALGFVCAGFLSAAAIPAFGWRALMLGLAVFSALWTLVLYFVLPESPLFVVRRRPDDPTTTRMLAQLGIGLEEARAVQAQVSDGRACAPRPGPSSLIAPAFRRVTLMTLFVVCCIYSVELLISAWLPAMLMAQGLSVSAAATATAVGKLTSIAGSVGVGWFMDRHGLVRVLSGAFFGGALALALLSFAFSTPVLLIPSLMCMCFFVDGCFSGSQALTVTAFPAHMRATASGWITGLARLIGGGSGTIAGGVLLNAGFRSASIAFVMLIAMTLGGTMLIAIGRSRGRAAAGTNAITSTNYPTKLRSTI